MSLVQSLLPVPSTSQALLDRYLRMPLELLLTVARVGPYLLYVARPAVAYAIRHGASRGSLEGLYQLQDAQPTTHAYIIYIVCWSRSYITAMQTT